MDWHKLDDKTTEIVIKKARHEGVSLRCFVYLFAGFLIYANIMQGREIFLYQDYTLIFPTLFMNIVMILLIFFFNSCTKSDLGNESWGINGTVVDLKDEYEGYGDHKKHWYNAYIQALDTVYCVGVDKNTYTNLKIDEVVLLAAFNEKLIQYSPVRENGTYRHLPFKVLTRSDGVVL